MKTFFLILCIVSLIVIPVAAISGIGTFLAGNTAVAFLCFRIWLGSFVSFLVTGVLHSVLPD